MERIKVLEMSREMYNLEFPWRSKEQHIHWRPEDTGDVLNAGENVVYNNCRQSLSLDFHAILFNIPQESSVYWHLTWWQGPSQPLPTAPEHLSGGSPHSAWAGLTSSHPRAKSELKSTLILPLPEGLLGLRTLPNTRFLEMPDWTDPERKIEWTGA